METSSSFYVQKHQRILFVGLACVDLFQILQSYPVEDLGHRCLDSYWQRGGNAGNSAAVLSILGGSSEYFGTLSTDRDSNFILQDLKENNVFTENCIPVQGASCPTSVVIISRESQSRTVLHTNKNLPELTFEQFQENVQLNDSLYGWIHFEGRDNACEIAKMLRFVIDFNSTNTKRCNLFKPITLSLEAEKLRFAPGLVKYDMWKLPDIMFVSKDFAKNEGYSSMTDAALGYFQRLKEGAVLICAWGDDGAAAISAQTGLVVSPSFKPPSVVDTCGAGDTFLAATVHALSQGKPLKESITLGCEVAGAKCGVQGFSNLKEKYFKVI